MKIKKLDATFESPPPRASNHRCPPRALDRLTGEEARLLDLEQRRGLPLHAAWVLVFGGDAPTLAVAANQTSLGAS